MSLRANLIGAILLVGSSYPSHAQMFTRTILPACYDRYNLAPLQWRHEEEMVDKAMEKYAAAARSGQSLASAYFPGDAGFHAGQIFEVDGHATDKRIAKDPWIVSSTRLERIAMRQSNDGLTMRAQWKAFSADNQFLGTYDTWMNWQLKKYKFLTVSLYSASASVQPKPIGPFCIYPGDIDENEAKKKERTQKR